MRTGTTLALALLVALWTTHCSLAQEQPTPTLTSTSTTTSTEAPPKLGFTLDTTYVSRYVWRGLDLFDDHAALQPSLDVDLFGTGFGINIWGSIPTGTGSNGHSNGINRWTEVDYTAYYGLSLFEEDPYAIDLTVNYIYYNYPKQGQGNHADTQELGALVEFPNLIPICDSKLVPSYYVGKLWPDEGGTPNVSGWVHLFGLTYELNLPGLIPGTKEQIVELTGDITYNDGMFGVDHDWSHATFGIATPVSICSMTLTPFVKYQITMDDSIDTADANGDDIFYGGVSLTYSF